MVYPYVHRGTRAAYTYIHTTYTRINLHPTRKVCSCSKKELPLTTLARLGNRGMLASYAYVRLDAQKSLQTCMHISLDFFRRHVFPPRRGTTLPRPGCATAISHRILLNPACALAPVDPRCARTHKHAHIHTLSLARSLTYIHTYTDTHQLTKYRKPTCYLLRPRPPRPPPAHPRSTTAAPNYTL